MTHPAYPTTAVLRAEARADGLLADHRAAHKAWTELVRRFREDALRLFGRMPMGLHIDGYTEVSVLEILSDWERTHDPDAWDVQDKAEEMS